MTMTRREFLRVSASSAVGLTIVVQIDAPREQIRVWTVAQAAVNTFQPYAYLRIGPDDVVTVWAIRLEMGQGIRTVLAMLVAEELEVEWSAIRVEQAPTDGSFHKTQLHTAGSSSVPETYEQMRMAGACAREMLVAAAAAAWSVPAAQCVAERGTVVHQRTGRRRTYGSLVASAATLPIPRAPRLKHPAQFTVLGKAGRRVDGPAIVTGRAAYGLDIAVPGMLYASITRAPTLGAQIATIDSVDALRVAGVTAVARVSAGAHAGVAVIARDSWSAMRGRDRLRVSWQHGAHATFDSERFIDEQRSKLDAPLLTRQFGGDADAASAAAPRSLDATYVYPFQAHAPVETMNCTAHVRSDAVELWLSTQSDVRTLDEAARVSGMPRERIIVHYALVGGGFGRRLFADFVAEAVELSKAAGAPVQLLWTRADDMRYGYFQPATTNRYRASLNAAGKITGVMHQHSSADLTIYDIHARRSLWNSPRPLKTAADFELPLASYQFPAFRFDATDVTSPVPTGPWRAVVEPAAVFARESFIDELAHATGKDPVAVRIELLRAAPVTRGTGIRFVNRARLLRVLAELAKRSASLWPPLPSPTQASGERFVGRGIAINSYQGESFLAMMAEVSVARDLSNVRVARIMTVVDCGMAINPLGIDGQTESAIAWGLSAALHGKITFRNGAVVESSYGDFEVLRMDRMPELDTIILDSTETPSGYGEHPVPLVAPAVANGVFAACGIRARTLPIRLV